MKILLTGHQGYIGTRLSPILLERGHEVVGLDTDLFQGCTFGSALPELPSLRCDIRDVTAKDLEGFEAVIHLAALSNDPLGDHDPAVTVAVNRDASVRLAKLARKAGVRRFVFASSCSLYGAAGEDFVTEWGEVRPVAPYGRSKAEAEEGILGLARDEFSPTFLRASTAYGLSPRMRFDLVVNRMTAWAFATGEIPVRGDGSAWRPLVHVEDVARAYAAAVEAPRALVHGRAFNVGSTAENYQVRDLGAIVSEVTGGRVVSVREAPVDPRSYRVDCNAIGRTLAEYKPQWTVRRGVEELVAGFRSAGLTTDDLRGPRFERIRHIRELIDTGELDRELRWVGVVGAGALVRSPRA